jgi:WD40 repeat protein
MSGSDDEYDPAEVVVPAPAPATTTPSTSTSTTTGTTAVTGIADKSTPLTRADLFHTSTPLSTAAAGAEVTLTKANDSTALLRVSSSVVESTEGDYRLRSDIKGRVRCLALNPAGTALCAGSEDGQLCMWDFNVPFKTYRVAPTRVLTPFVNRISGLQPIIALTWAKDGSYVVACQDGDSPALVRASGEQVGYCAMGERGLLDVVQCRGHRAPVTCVAAHHSDAAVFLTGSQDGTVRLWNHNTFKQHSVYAAKHGSGQVTDTHVVESVTTLQNSCCGHSADVFASGGQDGVVQLWDSRVKYRPGGALASVDMFAPLTTAVDNSNGGHAESSDPFFEKHLGGFLEVRAAADPSSASAGAATSTAFPHYGLAVRVGSVIKTIDLRKLSSSPAVSPAAIAQEAASGLPFVLDTTCLAVGSGGNSSSGSSSLLTCTSRAGYQNVSGGHVVQYTYRGSDHPLERTMIWRAGKPEEDVLCVCADRSRTDGCIYAGLSSGEVVVHGAFATGSNPQPLETWLQTRPEREGRGRVAGEKAPRSYDAEADLIANLF